MSGMEWDFGQEKARENLPVREVVPGEVLHEVFGAERARAVENAETGGEIVGNPLEDAQRWHKQEHPMSCAVACQEFVAEGLLKEDYSEERMRAFARRQGWFSEDGTTPEDAGKLLEAAGLEVRREERCGLEDIVEVLENGGKVMTSVNNMVLQNPLYQWLPGYTANHMVEVTGVDRSDPAHVRISLNDPGVENGAGIVYSLERFETAWSTGNHFMVSAYRGKGAA
jgi:hypothetical protein